MNSLLGSPYEKGFISKLSLMQITRNNWKKMAGKWEPLSHFRPKSSSSLRFSRVLRKVHPKMIMKWSLDFRPIFLERTLYGCIQHAVDLQNNRFLNSQERN